MTCVILGGSGKFAFQNCSMSALLVDLTPKRQCHFSHSSDKVTVKPTPWPTYTLSLDAPLLLCCANVLATVLDGFVSFVVFIARY